MKNVNIEYWKKLETGSSKINCDGAFEENSGAAAIKIIMRDEHGSIIDGVAKEVSVLFGVESEALAVKEAVSLAVRRSLDSVTIETDSAIVQQSIGNYPKENVRDWRIVPIIQDIKASLNSFTAPNLRWVSRKANIAANWVAVNTRKKKLMPLILKNCLGIVHSLSNNFN
ncbi:hypothetical protein COLO4_17181 [Corchorus olitorius]|uniref:RNase H type-1 domain-containing protein n=1 Tax=Corchorus olitorius TaxID=93759 RepID=A0A1R3JDR9_9ROSI|nr:hypothetical protein COLO4_17181 [Corchorus olitorius]